MTEIYSFEDIARAGKVVPLETVERLLHITEPVEQHDIVTNGSVKVKFTMPPNWNLDLKEMDPSNITSSQIEVEGVGNYYLSKNAILNALNQVGISDHYAYKTPGHLLAPHLDHWFANGMGKDTDIKMVTKGDYAVGFMRPDFKVISNLEVLKFVKRFFRDNKMKNDIYVDPNIVNSYSQTEIRLILSNDTFEVETERNGEKETDIWHLGLHISNSLITNTTTPLTFAGFLWERNSQAAILPDLSNLIGYRRPYLQDPEDLKGWVLATLDQVFSILPVEAEMVKQMPNHSLVGKMGPLTTDLFRSLKVHRKVQEGTLENLSLSGDMTSYGVMHAMAKTTSDPDLRISPKVVNHVQRVCGTLPGHADDMCDSCGRIHFD